MQLYKSDGRRVLDFIKENLGTTLPEEGLLAGQSVCSILLYLKKIKADVEVNDLDVFVCALTEKSIFSMMYNNPLGTGNIHASREENGFIFPNKEIHDSYQETDQLVERHRYEFEYANRIAQRPHVKTTAREEYAKSSKLYKLTHTYDEIGDYDFIDSLYKPYSDFKSALTRFRVAELDYSYRIVKVTRKGLLNTIFIRGAHRIGVNTPPPRVILKGFDINCCQVCICLKTGQIFYTSSFEKFMNTLQMDVTVATKPYHTLIRYMAKKEQFGFYGNDDKVIELISTYHDIMKNIREPDCMLLDQFYSSLSTKGHVPCSFKKVDIGKFGGRYMEKHKYLPSSKSAFKAQAHRLDVRLSEAGRAIFKDKPLNEKVVLYSLKPRQEGSKYILEGRHKQELERRLGTPVVDYLPYCLSNLPNIMSEVYKNTKKASVVNQFEAIKVNLDHAQTKKFKQHTLTVGLRAPASDFARNYSPQLLFQINKLIDVHSGFAAAFNNIPHDIQKSRLEFIQRLELDDIEVFYRAENCISVNWALIDKSSYSIGVKHIKGVANREKVKKDLLCDYDMSEPKTIDGITFTQLCRGSELKKESKIMSHCVSSYDGAVMRKTSKIFSISSTSGERATLETSGDYNSKKEYRNKQLRGKRNVSASNDVNKAVAKFLKWFNKEFAPSSRRDTSSTK
ncbi:hypothetical protein VCHA53O466_50331 [Vibrio chagasii]|nr:hypothetical protein VCHA53O466_50331 [Vibrio chagasii]